MPWHLEATEAVGLDALTAEIALLTDAQTPTAWGVPSAVTVLDVCRDAEAPVAWLLRARTWAQGLLELWAGPEAHHPDAAHFRHWSLVLDAALGGATAWALDDTGAVRDLY